MLNNVISIFESGAAAAAGDYESIATVTVGSGGTSSITFTSIPTTGYAHLQLRILGRITRSADSDSVRFRFNSDTGSTYGYHYLDGDGSAASAGANVSLTGGTVPVLLPADNMNASVFGAAVVDILDYANTNKYTTVRALGGVDNNSSVVPGSVQFRSGLWRDTSAISTIYLYPSNGTLFNQHSHFALYGIKGA